MGKEVQGAEAETPKASKFEAQKGPSRYVEAAESVGSGEEVVLCKRHRTPVVEMFVVN